MRVISNDELAMVSGGSAGEPDLGDGGIDFGKNNNGYGNGAEFGPPPGNSGAHNPQLTGWNSGPRGDR